MHAKALRTPALLLIAAAAIGSAQGQGGPEKSPFADADMPPSMQARCHEIRQLTQDAPTGPKRVDFSAVGALTLVHFDGTLAYLGLCAEPDPKVLCVTYSTNGLKTGDVVTVSGGYRRFGPDYIVLDPCLAARPSSPSP